MTQDLSTEALVQLIQAQQAEIQNLHAELYKMSWEAAGPQGYASWKEAALQERLLRIQLEKQLKLVEYGDQRWIAVSEQLPTVNMPVLLATEFGHPTDWRFKVGGLQANGDWWIPGSSWVPSHWMELPRPPAPVLKSFDSGTPNWTQCQKISDVPAVHEALRAFSEDSTEDNAVCIIQAIISALDTNQFPLCTAVNYPKSVTDDGKFPEGWVNGYNNAIQQCKRVNGDANDD